MVDKWQKSKGTWVEIEQVVLTPDQRAQSLPEETRNVPYVSAVSGFLHEGCRTWAGCPGKNDYWPDTHRNFEDCKSQLPPQFR